MQLDYHVLPTNVTDQTMKYTVTLNPTQPNNSDYLTVDADGLVTLVKEFPTDVTGVVNVYPTKQILKITKVPVTIAPAE